MRYGRSFAGLGFIWITAGVTVVGANRVLGTIILGRLGDGPVIVGKNVVSGHLCSPISPS